MTTAQNSTPALVPSTSSTKRLSALKAGTGSGSGNGTGAGSPGSNALGLTGSAGVVKDVVSPGELCGFVDTLLAQLETRFDDMSEQVISRSESTPTCDHFLLPAVSTNPVLLHDHAQGVNEMSNRIDHLENAIQDLMSGDIDSPGPGPASASAVTAADSSPAKR